MSVKKSVCAALAVAALAFTANAEVQPNAIGLRFGGGDFLGGELNYQKGIVNNRLETGISWSSRSEKIPVPGISRSYSIDYIGGVAAYQWYWNIADGFNWYAGPAAGVGFWSWSYTLLGVKHSKSGMYIDAGGQIGIEYDFNAVGAPVNLSLDCRPLLVLLDDARAGFVKDGGFEVEVRYTVGLGVRYTF